MDVAWDLILLNFMLENCKGCVFLVNHSKHVCTYFSKKKWEDKTKYCSQVIIVPAAMTCYVHSHFPFHPCSKAGLIKININTIFFSHFIAFHNFTY